jgi:WD40 repeat protein
LYAHLTSRTQGTISPSLCTAVRWVPSSTTLFLVSHADGTIIVYDKEREDGIFTANIPDGLKNILPHLNTNANELAAPTSVGWDPLSSMFVTPPPWHPEAVGRGEKGVVAKNPVSHWRLSRRSVVGEWAFSIRTTRLGADSDSWNEDFVFSPDAKYVAAISEDGCLRVVDPLAEQYVIHFDSYQSLNRVTINPGW